ncbi:ACT domain-containing protein, partial [Filifactor alocis]
QLNILDINQTLMEQYFTMIMLVNLEQSKHDITTLSNIFSDLGTEMGLSIRIQHENLFDSMYHV